jgi:hypothetical protein
MCAASDPSGARLLQACYIDALPIVGSQQRQDPPLNIMPGAYVTHARLLDLGSGEILSAEEGKVRIRFASGERSFMYDRVVQHLTVTTDAPQLPPAKSKPARAPSKRKR